MDPIPDNKKDEFESRGQDKNPELSLTESRGEKRLEYSPVLARSLSKKNKTASFSDLTVYLPTRIKKSKRFHSKSVENRHCKSTKTDDNSRKEVLKITHFFSKAEISPKNKRERCNSTPDNFLSLFLKQDIPSLFGNMADKVEIKIKVPDLDEDNYEVWKVKMMWQLQLYKLSGMVVKAHDDTIKAGADYVLNNLKACIAMKNKMSHQFVQKIDHFATAFEIWNFLDTYFIGNEKTKMAKFFEELIQTRDSFSDCSSLVSFLTRLREGIRKTTLELDEVMRYFLLRALPDNFDSVKVVIENGTATLEDNFQTVLRAERRMKQIGRAHV